MRRRWLLVGLAALPVGWAVWSALGWIGSKNDTRQKEGHPVPEANNGSGRVYRVDKFKVPAAARGEFLERVRMTHAVLRTVPGFVQDFLLDQTGGPGVFNFVTVVVWENAEAIERAKTVVAAKHKESGFDPKELLSRLGIEADLGVYTEATA